MAVGVINGLRRLAASMAVPQVGWHIGAHRRNGTAAGALAVRHDAHKRHRPVLTHGPAQDGEVGLGRSQHPAGQQDFPGEAIPEAPQHLMAAVRWEPIQRQAAPALSLGDPLQASGVGEREGEQCVVALAQTRDRPWGDSPPTGA
jgi:hypothetical protein